MSINSTVTLAPQKLTDGSTKLKLVSPFVPGFSDKARALGGTWNPTTKAWYFDQRDSDRVRALVLATFGVDPLAEPGDEPELVTVRVELNGRLCNESSVWMFGRELASRGGRDYAVRLGTGVILIAGSFPSHGGSVKNPRLDNSDGTILEVRDVPRQLAEQAIAENAKRAAEQIAGADKRAETPGAPNCDAGTIAGIRAFAAELNARVRIVESAPQPERVPLAQEQMVALAGRLDPASRKSAIMSVLLSLAPSERRDVLAEIEKFREQAAI